MVGKGDPMEESDEFDPLAMAALLAEIPGGQELLSWQSGSPNFCDGRVVSCCVDRTGYSFLKLGIIRFVESAEKKAIETATVTFVLKGMIDVRLENFVTAGYDLFGDAVVRYGSEAQKNHRRQFSGIDSAVPYHVFEFDGVGASGAVHATIESISLKTDAVPFMDYLEDPGKYAG